MESPHNSHKAESLPPSAFSLSIHNSQPLYRYTHAPAAYSDVTTNTTTIPCTIGAHTPAVFHKGHQVIFQAQLGASYPRLSWLAEKLSFTKILLMVCMWPAAIVLNYSFKDIQNNVWQILIYEKSQLNTLVWGSLTLALITLTIWGRYQTRKCASHTRLARKT